MTSLRARPCLQLPEDAKPTHTPLDKLKLNKPYYYVREGVSTGWGPRCFDEITEVIPLSVECKMYSLGFRNMTTTICTVLHKNIKTGKEETIKRSDFEKLYYEIDEKARKNIHNRQTTIAASVNSLPSNIKDHVLLPLLGSNLKKKLGGTRRLRKKTHGTRRKMKRSKQYSTRG